MLQKQNKYNWFNAELNTHLEGAHERLVHTHHGTGIVKLPTIVRSREEGDELPLCEKLITIFHHLRTEIRVVNTTYSKQKHENEFSS